MFERKISYPVYYVPFDTPYPEDVELGAGWLEAQPGERCLLVASGSPSAGTALGRLAASTRTVSLSQRRGASARGAVLAPQPTETVIGALIDEFVNKVTALCVIENGDEFCEAWLADLGATHVTTGEAHPPAEPLHAVAVYAMTKVARAVNHNNALLQAEDKSYAVLTLQELHRGGYLPDPTRLAAWAAANGFTGAEIGNLRDYAATVHAGRTFRLRETRGPQEGARTQWEAAVAGEATAAQS
ncbi:hypothetical protein Dvina_51750 [Dactylosporangium vinaceum]|uniref:Uncharacterized protein n=1 Tax=Dactylosporangium vinaceum TaxID=53362 RepID=A0ABV5M2L8_9ACTN|nr:hypothetical protein [Dactylosporangium vinaceum]UAB96314.1 hypothetical protein Dvina_51750 [Dactylosporangium vinaceum]